MRGRRIPAGFALLLGMLALAPATAQASGVLTVGVQGRGDVMGPGVACSEAGGDCTQQYVDRCDRPRPQPVPYPDPYPIPDPDPVCIPQTATATAANRAGTGFAFAGWSGCDAAAGATCTVDMADSRGVTALFVDVEYPHISVLQPGDRELRRGVVQLTAQAGDNAGVKQVDFKVNGEQVGSALGSSGTVAFDTTRVADGPLEVEAVATDTSQKTTESSRMLRVDNTKPTLAVSGVDGGKVAPGVPMRWTIDAADSIGLASVECSLEPKGSSTSFGPCNGGTRSYSATLRAVGEYVFVVRATDDAGNVTTSRMLQFAIDPDATRSPSGGTGGSSSDAGGVATFRPLVRNSFRASGRWTRFLLLSVSNLPTGARAELSCSGAGCPLKRKRFAARHGKVSLLAALKGRRLPAGARLTVRAIGPRGEQKVVTFTMRRGQAPRKTARCAPAGGRLGRCR